MPGNIGISSGVARLALVLALAATPAHAQQTVAHSGNPADIIVTARKTSERLQDVPIAITALTTETLNKANVKDALDIRYITPGLFAEQGQLDASSVYFNIRGQQSASGFYEASVGVYVNGVYQQSQYGLNGALFDLERVEVLKGPQGTLYGKNTTGGVINFISRKPDLNEFGGYVTGSMGFYVDDETNSLASNVEGAINIPLSPGVAALRISANYKRDEGFARDVNGRHLNDADYPYVRAQLLFKPNDNWELLLSGNYGRFRSNGLARIIQEANAGPLAIAVGVNAGLINPADIPTAGNPAGGPTFGPGVAGALGILRQDMTDDKFYLSHGSSELFSNLDTGGLSLTVDGDLSDSVHVKSVSAWRTLKNKNQNDVDGTPYDQFSATFFNDNDFYSQEVNLSGNLADKRLEWLLGGFYSYFNEKRGGIPGVGTAALTALSGVRGLFASDYKTESLGFFAHAVFKLTDAFSLTGGVRWSQDDRTAVPKDAILSLAGDVIACGPSNIGTTPLTGGTLENGCTFPTQRHKDDGISYEFAANYKFTPDIMVYATTRRGFRAGDINTNGQYLAYDPEYATDYELGLKANFLNRRVLFNIAGYYTKYTDVQKSQSIVNLGPPVTVGTAVQNAAKARIYGLEVETRVSPFEGFELTGTYTYTNPKYQKFLEPTATPGVFNDRSKEVFEVPKYMFNIGASYTLPVGVDDRLEFSANLYGQGSVIFGQNLSLLPSERILRQGAYSLLGGRISYKIGEDMSLSIFGKNLTNKHYYAGAGALRVVGVSYLQPQAPRFIGAEFSKKF